MSHADLLIELGCEELPARLLEGQASLLFDRLIKRLTDAGLAPDPQAGRWFATPRRLAVVLTGVGDRQADRVLERKGPAVGAAFDDNGNPTRAAEGFARSVGRAIQDLERLKTDDGEWLFARVQQPGQSLDDLLPDMLQAVVAEMAGARSMRWGERGDRFLRPVRWLVAVHGRRTLPVELFGLTASDRTRGHRVHAPGPFAVSADDYEAVLHQACVMADPAARVAMIRDQVTTAAGRLELHAGLDDALLAEVANLVEWPRAVACAFDPAFLDVPPEALVSSMQQHQKFFPLFEADGRLAPAFVAIANVDSRDFDAVRRGFERVITPRLADARFFWDQDRKQTLAARREQLAGIVFQEKLGSVRDRTDRIAAIAGRICAALGEDPATALRAAALCKSDLSTEMVGEFPDLQGTMGRYYALADGETQAVAVAIESHYRPRFAGDQLPGDRAGIMLALADRLDALLGLFAAGQKPRGGKDPFALRRAALGVVRLLVEADLELELDSVLRDHAAPALADVVTIEPGTLEAVRAFILERLRSHAAEQGIATNTLHAVEAGALTTLADFMRRAQAVQAFTTLPQADSLVAANKRIQNLLKSADNDISGDVDSTLLAEDAEKALNDALARTAAELEPLRRQRDYTAMLSRLAGLREPVDAFFEQVLVMTDDAALRGNRLKLLAHLGGLVADIADMARLGR